MNSTLKNIATSYLWKFALLLYAIHPAVMQILWLSVTVHVLFLLSMFLYVFLYIRRSMKQGTRPRGLFYELDDIYFGLMVSLAGMAIAYACGVNHITVFWLVVAAAYILALVMAILRIRHDR